MIELLVNAPRWLLLATLVYAPWAYGGTQPWTVTVLNIVLAAILVLWLVGCALRRSRPVVPSVLLLSAIWLVVQAWWMVGNAKSDYDTSTLQFSPLSPLLKWAPGTLHKSISIPAAINVSLLLLTGCFCCDLARRPLWKKRILVTMAGTGLSIVLLGLVQRVTGASGIFWGIADEGDTFFATFRYHANAGSFINLIWPISAFLVLLAFRREGRRSQFFWSAALVISLAGVFVNASRAANLIALALLGVWVSWAVIQIKRGAFVRAAHPGFIIVTLLTVVVLLAGLAAFGGLDTSVRRWGKFNEELSSRNPRLLVAQVCLRIIPSAGPCGFGPATFQTVFPYYTRELGEEISGVWLYAHDDYLQMLVEWGWLGGACWAVYIFGALVLSWSSWVNYRDEIPSTDRLAWFAMITALAGLLVHAGMDFPFQIPSIELYAVVLIGMLWSCRSWIGKRNLLVRLEKRLELVAA